MSRRRVAAAYLPQLLVELAAPHTAASGGLFAVLIRDPAGPAMAQAQPEVTSNQRIHQASSAARELGLRPGLTIAAARSLVPGLQVRVVRSAAVTEALGALAESCMSLSPCVALQEPDALLLELTGTAELFGGEERWMAALQARLLAAGHVSRVCIASGPDVALGVARYGPRARMRLAPGREKAALWPLPVGALGLSAQARQWLAAAGLRTVAALAAQPRDALARRLGGEARVLRLLELDSDALADGRPLTAHVPAECLQSFVDLAEHPEDNVESLLFFLKRAVDALAARMRGRQLAALELHLTLMHGRALAPTSLQLPLALPLWNAADLLGALRPLLERTELCAPVSGLSLELPRTTEMPPVQHSCLDERSLASEAPRVLGALEQQRAQHDDALARLWAELAAELGSDSVGVLASVPVHRPEQGTFFSPPGEPAVHSLVRRRTPKRPARHTPRLHPMLSSPWLPEAELLQDEPAAPAAGGPSPSLENRVVAPSSPLRLLKQPVALPLWPTKGEPLGPGMGRVRELHTARRLQAEWWREEPLKRDYLEVVLEGGEVAWVYVEPHSGLAQLQGWMD